MNLCGNTNPNSRLPDDATAHDSLPSPPPYLPPNHYDDSHYPSMSANLESPPITQAGHSYVTFPCHNSLPSQASSGQNEGQNVVLPDCSILQSSLVPVPSPAQTPSAVSTPATPPPSQMSIIILSPDLCPSPLQSHCLEDPCPDLECSICFSQFNNIFRCPKMLQCKHTFCLECLARMNVKSAEPNAIQCPLCRSLTPLPALGLPRLATDSDVLSYLPAAMQRVYSIRFLRNKGKLQVKRSSEGRQRWGQRSLTSLRSVNRSLDVGLPSPPAEGRSEAGGVGGALFRLTGRPACRAFLLTAVVMMMLLLMAIVIFLLIFRSRTNSK